MPKKIVTAPSVWPVSLTEAKTHLRVFTPDEDAYINGLIKSATADVEDHIQRALITQTWDVFFDCFSDEMELPKAPLQSITSVEYIDTDGAEQTEAASIYSVINAGDEKLPGELHLAYGQSWSSVRDQANAVTIRIVCGYGNAATVPEPIKSALKIKIELLRGDLMPGDAKDMERTYENLLKPYRVVSF